MVRAVVVGCTVTIAVVVVGLPVTTTVVVVDAVDDQAMPLELFELPGSSVTTTVVPGVTVTTIVVLGEMWVDEASDSELGEAVVGDRILVPSIEDVGVSPLA
ncbi:hypothetical protein CONLIGDRAFT_687570 [Coniochaeta ligniaria NRRL 30616]|uniref:Uncharacterized protein n=1 Tax=Coniochaeta ligniaria NRRL 30616 TaxID=1408157 RepID=A0A1J7I4J5_9PEZI|nr:hypothetical protein CONLIGDRAFT_687570 [Coniochaeta ligniaria NRRL 30616]